MVEEVLDYAILFIDVGGNILSWNKGAEQIKGYAKEEIIGKNFRIFYQMNDRKRQLPEKLLRQAMETGKATHEGWRVRKDKSKFWGSVLITTLHGENKSIIGFSKVTKDLTEKKLADDKIHAYTREIEMKNQKLEEYAHVTSHDLQEPLRKIQVFTDLLKKDPSDEERTTRYIEKIHTSAHKMTSLIQGVLSYSSLLDSSIERKKTDLNHLMQEVLEDFAIAIEERNATIKCSTLPVLTCIPVQLYQLFSNLLSNALKFTVSPPHVTICATSVDSTDVKKYHLQESIKYVKLIFKDNGIGFDQQYASQIFTLFKRLDHSRSGTGVGLALCKRIVENHKGYIGVETTPNDGSTFMIFLPQG